MPRREWMKIQVPLLLVACAAGVADNARSQVPVDRDPDAILFDPGPHYQQRFGGEIARDGDRLLVTRLGPSEVAGVWGKLFVFERTPLGYRIAQTLQPEIPLLDGTFGYTFAGSPSVIGDRLFLRASIGYQTIPSPPTYVNRVGIHVYDRTASGWQYSESIRTAPEFGSPSREPVLAASLGTQLFAGTNEFTWIGSSGNALDGGVYVIETDAPSPVIQQYLREPTTFGPELGNFATLVEADGGVLAIASSIGFSRVIYMYEQVQGQWEPVQRIVHPLASSNSPIYGLPSFATSLAIDGESGWMLVGASREAGTNGRAYFYERDATTGLWEFRQSFGPVEGSWHPNVGSSGYGSLFGCSTAIEGNLAAVGAFYEETEGQPTGAVSVFRLAQGQWTRERRLAGPQLYSNWQVNRTTGTGVSIEGGLLAVADNNRAYATGGQTGIVYIWELGQGEEICVVPTNQAELRMTFRPEDPAQLRPSVHNLDGPGFGLLLMGTPASATPFGTGQLCLGQPMRVTAPWAFAAGQSSLFLEAVHPDPTAPNSYAFQFLHWQTGSTTGPRLSTAQVVRYD